MCARGQRPPDEDSVTQLQVCVLVPADPPRPTIQTEKEEKTPKTRVGSEIRPCVLHSRKELNENHEIEKHLYFSSGFKKLRLVLKDYIQRGSGPRCLPGLGRQHTQHCEENA